MGVDWDFIDDLTEEQIKDSGDDDHLQRRISHIFTSSVDDSDLSDHGKVKRLLSIAGLVVQQKDSEILEIERYGSELVENAEQRITALERQLKEQKSLNDDLQNGGTGRDARYLRDELRTAQAENDRLRRESKEISSDASSARENVDRLTNELMESKAKNRTLEGRCDQLSQDILDLQKQLEAQREALIIKREGEEGRISKRLKDQENTQMLNEIHELTEANEYLKDEVERITGDLKTATSEVVKLTDEYMSMKTVIEETDKVNNRLQEENAGMKLQVQDLQQQLLHQGSLDNNLMSHVNAEVEKWKVMLSESERKLEGEKDKNHVLQQQLDATKMDNDKIIMAELVQAAADKDKQIEDLKKELEEGYKLMERMGEIADQLQESEPVRETNHLEQQLNDYKSAARSERERCRRMEAESAERDKQLAEALVRIGQYENNIYGLPDAVQEIKDLKKQIGIRDDDIKNLTAQMNKLERNLCTALDENEEMRRRLGLGPSDDIDLTELKFTKAAEQEQSRAVNRLLVNEVERLERERIDLKKLLRKQAMHRGVRAVELGLKTEDLEAIEEAANEAGLSANQSQIIQEELIDNLKRTTGKEAAESAEYKRQVSQLNKLNTELSKAADDLTSKNDALNAQIKIEKAEREKFENALKEALKGKGGKLEDNPEIYRLLALLEDRLHQTNPDITQHLKSQVAQLSGRNLELRSELARTKEEIRRCERERADAVADLARFGGPTAMGPSNNIFIQHQGDGASVQPLTRQLIIALQEVEEKETTLKEMEKQLLNAQDQLSRLTAQQGMLYEEHCKIKMEQENDKLKQNSTESHESNAEIYKNELERLRRVIDSDSTQQKTSLTETSRKLVLLKVNERTMKRELTSLYEREERNEREIRRLKVLDEYRTKTSQERICWLEQYKDTATYQLQQLRDELLTCVPQREVEKLYDSYTNISTKYRQLLEEESMVQTSAQKVSELQDELNQTQNLLQECQTKLLVKEQRCTTLENRLTSLTEPTQDKDNNPSVATSQLEDKVYNVEVQLLNEKQKATHAINKHSKLLKVTQELEDRNNTLEEKFSDLIEKNKRLQDQEKSLTQQLEAATKTTAKDSRSQALEKQITALQSEVRRIQTVADISADQTRTLLARRNQRDSELETYKVSLAEMEKQTDDKLTIGLLTRRIVEIQNRDIESQKLVEVFKIKTSQAQNKVLSLESKLLEQQKLQDLHHKRVRAHVQLLSRTLCYLRGQYAGAVPLQRQQRLGEAVRSLISEKQELSLKYTKLDKEKGELEVELEHLKSETDKKYIVTSVSKVRLSEMRLKREVVQLKQQLQYLEKITKDHESTIRDLEEENAGVYELLTEHKILDSSILDQDATHTSTHNIQPQKLTEYVLCSKCKCQTSSSPDKPSKLVSLEIDYLTKQLKMKENKIKTHQEETELLKTSLTKSHSKINQLNRNVDKLEEQLAMKDGSTPEEFAGFKKSQVSAQQAIQALQDRIDQKDNAISKYQNMLKDLREQTKQSSHKNEREIHKINKEHSTKEHDWLVKYQELSAELQTLQEFGSAPAPHKRAELEELVLEQDKENATLRDSIFKLREEISDLKTERAVTAKNHDKDKDKIKAEYEHKLKKSKNDLKDLNQKHVDTLGEINFLKSEIKTPRGENHKSPSSKSRQVNDKLKAELSEKERENVQLKQALSALKQEMTELIESKMRETVNTTDNDVQALIKRETVKLSKELESLRSKCAKLQKERDEFQRERAVLESQISNKVNPRQATEIERLEKQVAVQRDKITKLKNKETSVGVSKPSTNRDLQDKITELQKQLDEAKKDSGALKPANTVMETWLENKKWHKKIELQKKQIETKDKEIETLKKQNTSMRETIERLDREKNLLNTRLKNTLKGNCKHAKKDAEFTDTQIFTQELKKKIFDLEEEKQKLQEKIIKDITNPLLEKDQTITVLQQTLSSLENQLQKYISKNLGHEKLRDFNHLREANTEQEKKLIEAKHSILSYKLRAEHAELELPRLRTRVHELQSYTEVLKPLPPGKTAAPVPGKSVVELERVINAMKRVIEKLQKENSQQKSQIDFLNQPSENKENEVGESEKMQTLNTLLQKDNSDMKQELDSRAEEAIQLKKEISDLKTAMKETQEKYELEKQESEKYLDLRRQVQEKTETVETLKRQMGKVVEENSRKNSLLSEVKRRLTGVVEKEADLEEEIRLLHQCQMPSGAKEIAKEAVRIKRQNADLSAQLKNLTANTAPALDPVILEKLDDFKQENEVMVKKLVFYQTQLKDLSSKYPNEHITIEYTL